MSSALKSLVDTGTKLWLDSIDPDEIETNLQRGATGATSNPIIVSGLLETGRFDDDINKRIEAGDSDEDLAWNMTDQMVEHAQSRFHDIWKKTEGNDGYVSFELDPLLEDGELGPPHDQRVARYIELAKQWSAGHDNRMIKIPATEAGLAALEEVAAAGITINVTLIFSEKQYEAAREAIWRGRQKLGQLDKFKSVYSIFISRVDVYTDKQVPELSDDAQGMVGIVNAKRLWQSNQQWWKDKGLKLQQEIIFASTGAKMDWQAADYYVEQMAGSDIQTNPPATNAAIEEMGKTYSSHIAEMPHQSVLDEIDEKVNKDAMTDTLMSEGTAKFADPFKKLLKTIGEKRDALTAAS